MTLAERNPNLVNRLESLIVMVELDMGPSDLFEAELISKEEYNDLIDFRTTLWEHVLHALDALPEEKQVLAKAAISRIKEAITFVKSSKKETK